MDLYTETNNRFYKLFEDKIDYQDIYNKIRKDPKWLAAIENGRVRPGHPEGKIKYHIAQVEEYLDAHKGEVSEDDYWRLKIMTLVHDAFKRDGGNKVPIMDPTSHASMGRQYAAEYVNDHDMEMMLQYHDYPFTLWRKAKKGIDVSDKIKELLNKIKNKKVYDLFMSADGSGPGKDKEPMDWWLANS
jgi:hypothetical protein